MSDRSDRIILADNEPRCEPAGKCLMRSRCARVQALIVRGNKSFPVRDYSDELCGGTALCPGFLSLAERHIENKRPPIKPAVKGLA